MVPLYVTESDQRSDDEGYFLFQNCPVVREKCYDLLAAGAKIFKVFSAVVRGNGSI